MSTSYTTSTPDDLLTIGQVAEIMKEAGGRLMYTSGNSAKEHPLTAQAIRRLFTDPTTDLAFSNDVLRHGHTPMAPGVNIAAVLHDNYLWLNFTSDGLLTNSTRHGTSDVYDLTELLGLDLDENCEEFADSMQSIWGDDWFDYM